MVKKIRKSILVSIQQYDSLPVKRCATFSYGVLRVYRSPVKELDNIHAGKESNHQVQIGLIFTLIVLLRTCCMYV